MRILIITQKVDKNASDFGFFHTWIKEFAKNFEEIIVVCLYKGEYDLPKNVKVFSLGKERGISKFGYVSNFFSIIFRERKNYDAVFVHMNQIYVILGGLFWKLWSKPIYLWYVHKSVSLSLRLAEKLVTKIFTASKESFRLSSNKVQIVGHGIDTELFKSLSNRIKTDNIRLITHGRISPAKNIGLVIEMVAEISKLGKKTALTIVGDPGTRDQEIYLEELKKKVIEDKLENLVTFVRGLPQNKLPEYLSQNDIFINFSTTGSIDKAVLEAYFSGLKILTTNEAFSGFKPPIFFEGDRSAQTLAQRVIKLYDLEVEESLSNKEEMLKKYSLPRLIEAISNEIK